MSFFPKFTDEEIKRMAESMFYQNKWEESTKLLEKQNDKLMEICQKQNKLILLQENIIKDLRKTLQETAEYLTLEKSILG
jgi:hypothetical protein